VDALAGIRVLDLSRLLPGPWATTMLADFGADVVKVELPGVGDYSRWSPPFVGEESAYYLTLNRNKRSLVLDLDDERGRRAFDRLVQRADVLVHSFRAGAPERRGLDYKTLSASNPRLVYCAVTGYGQDGPYRDLAGHDANVTAYTGMFRAHVDGPPRLSNFQLADFAAASMAAIAIPTALLARESTGRGQQIDVSMLDSLLGWMQIAVLDNFALTHQRARNGRRDGRPMGAVSSVRLLRDG